MAQTINSNLMLLNARKYLDAAQQSIANQSQRIGSGQRINNAKDDAAGLAIAERMNAELRSMSAAMRNAYNGISLAQTAEGGLQEVSSTLQRMRELAVQSANGTNTDKDRENLDKEFSALNEEISRIAQTTTFNGESVLDSSDNSYTFQAGGGNDAGDTVSVSLPFIDSVMAGSSGSFASIDSYEASLEAIGLIDSRINEISSARANLGSVQSLFESTISNLKTGFENQSAARARIVDADFAVETANLTRSLIQQQASNTMTIQANVDSSSVLRLLG